MIIFCTGLYGPTLEQYLKQAIQLVKAQSTEMAHHSMTPSPSLIVTTAYLAISLLDFSNTQLIQNYPLVKHAAAGIASLQPLRQSLASTYISSPVGGSVLSSIRPPPPSSSSITYASRPASVYSSSLPVTTTVVGVTTSHVVNPLPVSLAPPKVNRIVSKPKIVKAD